MGRTKSANGSGNIRKRTDGRWEGRYSYLDDMGRPRRGSVYGRTQREVRQQLQILLGKVDTGQYYGPVKRYTLGQWLDEWLELYTTNLAPASQRSYKNRVEKIKEYLGDNPLQSLTNAHCQRFVVELSRAGLSPKSVKLVHGVLHKALEQAVLNQLIPHNPSDHCNLPRVEKPQLDAITDDRVPAFLEAIKGDDFEILYFVALFTGLRQAELLGLQWSDIDTKRHLLHVKRQLQKTENGYVFTTPKHGKTRSVPMAASVEDAFQTQKRRQAEQRLSAGSAWESPYNLVFTNSLGGHCTPLPVRRHFKKIVTGMGLPQIRFHDLRHSYAINQLQLGANPKEVCDALGHYSTSFTMDVYGGVSVTAQERSRERLDEFIRDALG